MLLLFDIDGTLVRSRPLTHQAALAQGAAEVFGLELLPGTDPVADVEPWGKVDRQIIRQVLERAGLQAPRPMQMEQWESAAAAAYARLETEPRHDSELEATAAALAELRDAGHLLALVTGNLEPIARRKLGLRGLDGFFPPGQGGFGSDADLRPELVPIARSRADTADSPHPREDTVVIGDTPLDVAAASADGVRCIAITGERFSAQALLDAGAVATVDAIPEVAAALSAL